MHEINTPEIHKVLEETPNEELTATTGFVNALSVRKLRRNLLRRSAGLAIAGIAVGALVATEALCTPSVSAEVIDDSLDLIKYFTILSVGEAMFATLYSEAVARKGRLNFNTSQLITLNSIRYEEELHLQLGLQLLKVAGGKLEPRTLAFDFPSGTFDNFENFIHTQQLAEELTNGALLAWIKDMAVNGHPHLAQIGGQLMQVEGGHRVAGRALIGDIPFTDWAFGDVANLNGKEIIFTDVPDVLKANGFNPDGTTFQYTPPQKFDLQGLQHTTLPPATFTLSKQ